MNIVLNLKNHCVQTEIKRQYNHLISKCFKLKTAQDFARSETAISLLQTALETLDFGWLRATYPELRGGGEDDISLSAGSDGTLLITINGRRTHATHPNHPL